jgi:hypothetical protein
MVEYGTPVRTISTIRRYAMVRVDLVTQYRLARSHAWPGL